MAEKAKENSITTITFNPKKTCLRTADLNPFYDWAVLSEYDNMFQYIPAEQRKECTDPYQNNVFECEGGGRICANCQENEPV